MIVSKYLKAPDGFGADMSQWLSLSCYAIGLFLVIILLPLTHEGMFFDGVIYATLAKNLHLGHTTLWRPVFSETMLNPFYEHPPLALYLQSCFFKIFGTEYGAEQAYAVMMAVGQFGLIAWYWLYQHKTHILCLGLLLFLWIISPPNWLYINNYLIATLALFTTLASIVLMIRVETKKGLFLQYFFSSAFVFIAFFCDGPVAFFPVVIPILRKMIYEPKTLRIGCLQTLSLGLILTVFFFVFFKICPEALVNTRQFLHQQVIASVLGTRASFSLNTPGIKHVFIVGLFLKAYAPISLFVVGCMVLSAKIKQQPLWPSLLQQLKNRRFLFLISIALVAALPVGLSCRQGMRYILPSAPFAVLAMMELGFHPYATILVYCKRQSWFKWLNAVWHVLFAVIVVWIGTSSVVRYQRSIVPKVVQDARAISVYCEKEALCRRHHIISVVDGEVLQNISYYLARYTHTEISIAFEPGFPYHIGFKNDPIPEGYHEVDLPLSIFNLSVVNVQQALKTYAPSPIQAI